MKLLKYRVILAALIILVIICTACAPITPGNVPVDDEAYAAFHKPEISNDKIIYSIPNEALEIGKKFLAEKEVGYDQVIRFTCNGGYYEAIGSTAITSIAEANKRYPDLRIPKKLGNYKFVDLTVDYSRMREVGENEVPKPSDKIEVLDNRQRPPVQFYLCYRNGISQFRVNLLPVSNEEGSAIFEGVKQRFDEWDLHNDAYLQGIVSGGDEVQSEFGNLMIMPEKNENYAFWVQKVSNADCLQSHAVDFSENEASYIYDAIRENF